MNVNEMAERILDAYRKRDDWNEANMQDHLLQMVGLIDVSRMSLQIMRRYGYPLIHGTCAISPNDCEFWEECQGVDQRQLQPCTPEGLAFRLSDMVLYTLAVMQELGLDCDKVITAEFNYQVARADEAEVF